MPKSVSGFMIKKHPHGRGEDSAYPVVSIGVEETPPRAWGRLEEKIIPDPPGGNTPTGVGKTNVYS